MVVFVHSYDLSASKPNPYAKRLGARGRQVLVERYLRSENLVRLDADVAGRRVTALAKRRNPDHCCAR